MSVGVGESGIIFCRSRRDCSRLAAEVGGICQAFCGSRQDWSNFLWDWLSMFKSLQSVEVCRSGQTFCGSGQDLSNFLWVWLGLLKISAAVAKYVQECMSEWTGLVKHSAIWGMISQQCLHDCGIGQTFFESGKHWANFLWAWVELVKPPEVWLA